MSPRCSDRPSARPAGSRMFSDFVVMRKGALLAISSPRSRRSRSIRRSSRGNSAAGACNAETTGKVDYAVDTDEEALDLVKKFLSYLPSHHNETPPRPTVPAGSDDAAARDLLDLVPEDRSKVYDMRKVIAAIADKDSVLHSRSGLPGRP